MSGLISQEKTNAKREGDEIAKGGTEVEKKDGGQKDEGRGFQSLRAQEGGEGFPDLVEDDRNGEEETGIKG
jgi:hypothetical protein